jgi:hypothetical protein
VVLRCLPAIAAMLGLWWMLVPVPLKGAQGGPTQGPAQAPAEVDRSWTGQPSPACLTCHTGTEPMHRPRRVAGAPDTPDEPITAANPKDREGLTCVDCHGGNGSGPATVEAAHVHPRNHKIWASAAHPQNSYAALNEESPEFVRFMNPSDFRIADATCGRCHSDRLNAMRTSVMSHNAMVHNAVFYNNGSREWKVPLYGETFDRNGSPALLSSHKPLSEAEKKHGALEFLAPHPEWEITKIKDPLRVAEVNNPALGTRGPGTDGRIAAVYLNVLKTRLNDPTLWFLGPNKIGGDYRASGCAACHVVYANDRSPWASAQFAKFGNRGTTETGDAALKAAKEKGEPGHPIYHRLELSVPASQCLVCHYHQGDGAIGTYTGRIWWDRETDADAVTQAGALPDYGSPDYSRGGKTMENMADHNAELPYDPTSQVRPTAGSQANLDDPRYQQTQFSDFHAHGWNFMNVYKRDAKGHLRDSFNQVIPETDPDKWKKAIHLRDIHLEKGMQCIDCHTSQDLHGDGNIYGQMTDYIEIRCVDCHGTVAKRADLLTSGHSWQRNDLRQAMTPWLDPADPERKRRLPRFYERDGRLYQRSMMVYGLDWQVKQVTDIVDPNMPDYSPKAAYAKLVRQDGVVHFGADRSDVAHNYEKMECASCHSAWQTTCSGCHLPLDLNVRSKDKHYADEFSRGYAPYNQQAVRVDSFFLGIGTTNHGNKVTPFRPASSVIVSAYDRNRNNVVHQQPLISSPGFSNEAVTPHPPHTVRTKETRQCTDCHLSQSNDNNAKLSMLLGFGANSLNFMGTYAFVAEQGKGVTAVQVAEGIEPQPVIGSRFYAVTNSGKANRFEAEGRRLKTAYSRRAPTVQALTVRGEYLLAAEGRNGLKVYDIARINDKSAAQRIVQAVNSRLGERMAVPSRDATFVHLPSSLPVHVGGEKLELNRNMGLEEIRKVNGEQALETLYRYALVTDREEGLILVDVDTLTDANPENNRLTRGVTFNPGGKLVGARMVKNLGHYAYVVSEKTGLSVVDLEQPLAPRLVYQSAPGELSGARAIELQFRYAFVLDRDGLKVFDVTDKERPVRMVSALVRLSDARGLCVSRTYAYIAAGRQGLVIVDVQDPTHPAVLDYDHADAPLEDAYDVAVATTNASFFAYVADGKSGLRVLRLIEAQETPGHFGFSPTPTPKLIATYPTSGIAVAVNRGQVRDRFVDESGGQMVVSNRIGSRTFNREEMRRFLYYPDNTLMKLTDDFPAALRHEQVNPSTRISLPGSKAPAARAATGPKQ